METEANRARGPRSLSTVNRPRFDLHLNGRWLDRVLRSAEFRALLVSAGGIGLSLLLLPPFWAVNDDVGMAMVAGGFGESSAPSPSIFLSNVLWGDLAVALTHIAGVRGYSVLNLGLLSFVAWGVLVRLMRAGLPTWGAIATSVLIFIQPFVFPTFTVIAGLCAALGCLLLADSRPPSTWYRWPSAAALLWVAFLVRSDITALVAIVSIPLWNWGALTKSRAAWASAGVAAIAAVGATGINEAHYSGPEWSDMAELEAVRVPFTDYKIGSQFDASDLREVGLTSNDLRLVESWFQIDPEVADPVALERLLAKADWREHAGQNLSRVVGSFGILVQPGLLSLAVAAGLASAASRRRWRLATSWVLFVSAATTLALLGRPFPFRLWLPLLSLMLLLALLSFQSDKERHRLVTMVLVSLAAIPVLGVVVGQHAAAESQARLVQSDLERLPRGELLYVWGAAFPDVHAYRPTGHRTIAEEIPIAGLGSWSNAPFAKKQRHRFHTRPFSEEISNRPISVVAFPQQMALLPGYCREHLGAELNILREQKLTTLTRYVVMCQGSS